MSVSVCASACAVGKELRTAFVNMSTVELFKVYVLFKHVPNVTQDRNKDVKVKTVTFDFLNIERLLPSTGDSMPLLRKKRMCSAAPGNFTAFLLSSLAGGYVVLRQQYNVGFKQRS